MYKIIRINQKIIKNIIINKIGVIYEIQRSDVKS